MGCCGVAVSAVVVNHSGIQLANESGLEGFSQQTVGCDPTHMEVCPSQDDCVFTAVLMSFKNINVYYRICSVY